MEVFSPRTGLTLVLSIAMAATPVWANQLLFQSLAGFGFGLPDGAETGDRTGEVLATGDFNCDNIRDLAIGVPTEDSNAGAVIVLHGSASGLNLASTVRWTQTSIGGGAGLSEPGDQFGGGLAAGDFNSDTCSDLAIGAPGEDSAAGRVTMLFGSAGTGLQAAGAYSFTEPSPASGERFGASMTVIRTSAGIQQLGVLEPVQGYVRVHGSNSLVYYFYGPELVGAASMVAADFNGSGCDQVAVGRPSDVYSLGGQVRIFPCNGSQVTLAGNYAIYQQPGFRIAEAGDEFGFSLAAGRFNGDSYADLAVGVPGERFGAGAVAVLYGGSTGITTAGSGFFLQDSAGIPDTSENGDRFGHSLLVADWNGDFLDDIVVGIPYEDTGALNNNGAIQVLLNTGTIGPSLLFFTQSAFPLTIPTSGANFGLAMAAGDFNGNGVMDTAVSAPGSPLGAVAQAGIVNVTRW